MNEEDKKVIKHYWLYILELEQKKYYVGITASTPEKRMQQHVNGFGGARWTKKYKPLKLIDRQELGYVTYLEAEVVENRVAREYMKKYRLNNVRGGNLTDTDDYVTRFGWIYVKDDWYIVTGVTFLTLVIIYLLIDKLFF